LRLIPAHTAAFFGLHAWRGRLLAERADPDRGGLLRTWLDQSVASAFAEHVVPVDEAVARRAAALHVPDPAPFRDAGATAIVHHMTVVTRNLRDFERFDGLPVMNPWRSATAGHRVRPGVPFT
jgi:toxin FitB